MANASQRLESNVDGDVFVDASCIDCGTCRWMAPDVFDRSGSQSRVHRQPQGDARRRAALQALVACPTSSIGTAVKAGTADAARSFPAHVIDGVRHCGFHAEASYGAAPWLIERPDGNVLVDVPRFSAPLADRIATLGPVSWLFLTHRDDVAEHDRWAARLGCERVLHAADQSHRTRDVERLIHGDEEVLLAPDLRIIPTPGHTPGSACLLWRDQVLFTGDHLAWSPEHRRLTAFRGACWHDWATQIASMVRLQGLAFTAVLPGHGAPVVDTADRLSDSLARCITWMRSVA